MTRLWREIDSAAALLADAGIDSARFDAEQLAAHLAGTDRGRLPLLESPGDEFFGRYHDVVAARSQRIPLQHLMGTAAFGPMCCRSDPVCSYRVRRPKQYWRGPLHSGLERGR